MTNTEFQKHLNDIQEKIGKDASSLVLDDIGKLLTDNKAMNENIIAKDKEIADLKRLNENLQVVNVNLLQQVPMATDPDFEQKENQEKKKQPINFNEDFDEFGNFKK